MHLGTRDRFLSYCVLCMLVSGTRAAPTVSQSSPWKIEDALSVLSLPIYAPISLSPDGEWVAYTVQDDRKAEATGSLRYQHYSRTGAYRGAIGCNIWITNTQSRESRNLTQGVGTSWDPVWSPDGKYLAFYSDRGGTAHLWIWESATGQMRELSDSIVRPGPNYGVPRWTPDSRRIVFKALPEGMTIEQGADVTEFVPAPTKSSEHAGAGSANVSLYQSTLRPAGDKQVDRSDDLEPSYQNWLLADIAVVDLDSGKIERLARKVNALGYWISPDGRYLAYNNWKGVDKKRKGMSFIPVVDLAVVSLATGNSHMLARNLQGEYTAFSFRWSPDSHFLAYTALGSAGVLDCYVVSIEDGKQEDLTPGLHAPIGTAPPVWDSRGAFLYLTNSEFGQRDAGKVFRVSLRKHILSDVANLTNRSILEVVGPMEGGRFWTPDEGKSMVVVTRNEVTKEVGFFKVDLATGQLMKLSEENAYFGPFLGAANTTDVSRDGRTIVYVSESVQHPQEIWVVRGEFRDRQRLTNINPQLDGVVFGTSRLISWSSLDGLPLHGALLLPANYEPRKTYPLVVWVYAGAYLSDQLNLFGLESGTGGLGIGNMQIFATRGYAVLLPDSPVGVGTPMQDVLRQVIPGVCRVVEAGIADPNRLGVMGHSNGGYSTLALIVQTKRFKAAAEIAGAADLVSMYGHMDDKRTGSATALVEESELGGTPWQFRDRYIENSPIFYLDRVETPLLVVHGGLDTSVPPEQAEEIFVGLRRLGKEVVYARYNDGGHNAWSIEDQLDFWNRIISWFEKYLTPEDGSRGTGESGTGDRGQKKTSERRQK